MSRTLNIAADSELKLLVQSQRPIFATGEMSSHVTGQEQQLCAQLIEKLTDSHLDQSAKISRLLETVQQQQFSRGIGYYDSKNLYFLEYLIHLHFYELFKVNGCDLTQGQALAAYQRLVYLKTLLLKLAPIEKKLEYQTNKILRSGQAVEVKPEPARKMTDYQQGEDEQSDAQMEVKAVNEQDEDPLAYQPRPKQLIAMKQSKPSNSEEKYVAPKISSNLSKEEKVKERVKLQKERRKSFLVRKFRGDLVTDDVAEERGVESELAQKLKHKYQEQTRFEEDNFMRFRQNKKDKFLKSKIIKEQLNKNPLEEELKQIKMISEIFAEERDDKPVRRGRPAEAESGRKKQKRS